MLFVGRLTGPLTVAAGKMAGALVAVVAILLILNTGALAQAPPPGPQQGTGPWAENGQAIDTWEEYGGGMLLIFNPKWVFQAFPDGCGFSDTAVCYTWKQYHYFSADPYNTTYWLPYARGCMALGADPISVGTAAGLSQQTDISSVGENWIPEIKALQTDTATNTAASGSASAPVESALPSPWTYERCFSGAGPSAPTVASCTMDYTGNWNGQVSDRRNTVTLSQVGQGLTVRITAGAVFDDEIAFLTDPASRWSVSFTGNSSFSFEPNTLKARVVGRTLQISGAVAGAAASSTFGLQVVDQGSNGSWNLTTCNMTL